MSVEIVEQAVITLTLLSDGELRLRSFGDPADSKTVKFADNTLRLVLAVLEEQYPQAVISRPEEEGGKP